MLRPSTSCDLSALQPSPNSKSVRFQFNSVRTHTTGANHSTHIRSILKCRQYTNLLKAANDKMLRDLEQCVEERDLVVAGIVASPTDLSQLSPRTRAAQKRYRDDMFDERDLLSSMIEDKFDLLRETLRDEDMPCWMRGHEGSTTLTLVGLNQPAQHKLFRRQSSLNCQSGVKMSSSHGLNLTAVNCAMRVERLRREFARRDSEAQLSDTEETVMCRLSQRLAAH